MSSYDGRSNGVDVVRARARRPHGLGKISGYSETNCMAGVSLVEAEEQRVKIWIWPPEQAVTAYDVFDAMVYRFCAYQGFVPLFMGALTPEVLRVDLLNSTAEQVMEFIRRGFREMHDDRQLEDFRYSRLVFRGIPGFRTVESIVRGTDSRTPELKVHNQNVPTSTLTNDKAFLHGIS